MTLDPKTPIVPITKAQTRYLEMLFEELQFTNNSRNIFLTNELKRPIRFLDELGKYEVSPIIDYLKKLRDEKRLSDQRSRTQPT